jgi:hypothetical protein
MSKRVARASVLASDLIGLGAHPRVAKAVGAALTVNLGSTRTASRPLLARAIEKASVSDLEFLKSAALDSPSLLCGDLGRNWSKVSKEEMGKDYDNEDGEEAIRAEERDLSEQTMKLGYSVARSLGLDVQTSLFAGCYAFTKL